MRFHLHPSVKANKLSDGRGAMLMLPSRDAGYSTPMRIAIEIEESVYLPGSDGPRRALQIVIYGRARKVPRVHWSFNPTSSTPVASGERRPAADERRSCRCNDDQEDDRS